MLLYLLLCALGIAVALVVMYGTRRMFPPMTASRGARAVMCVICLVGGVWMLADFYEATRTGEIRCGRRSHRHQCERSQDPVGFGMSGLWLFAVGTLSIASAAAFATFPGPDDED